MYSRGWLKEENLVLEVTQKAKDYIAENGYDNVFGARPLKRFIQKYAEELKDYYAKLLRIKRRIGLWGGETQIEHLSLKPVLLIVNTYKGELSGGREIRKKAIEGLKSAKFETIIVDYPDLCK